MKAISLSKNSWHYLLATKLSNYEAPTSYTYEDGYTEVMGDNPDICTYTNAVLRGLLALVVLAAAYALISWVLSHMVIGVYFSLLRHEWFFTVCGEVGMLAAGLIIVIITMSVGIIALGNWYRHRPYRLRRTKPAGFIQLAYKSWREKFCIVVEFVDDSKK